MGNSLTINRLYRASAIKDILKIARESARQEEHRTKRYISEALGISVQRVSDIESGTAQCPLDIAIEWCRSVADRVALEKVQHIYGLGLPPTDPRLLQEPSTQVINFKTELKEAMAALEKVEEVLTRVRPNRQLNDHQMAELERSMKQFKDAEHASRCLQISLSEALGVSQESVDRAWITHTVSTGVTIPSVDFYSQLKRSQIEVSI